MNYRDIDDARSEALRQLRLADIATRDAAALIVGRLKTSGVHDHVLVKLKRELSKYNARTGEWKE